MSAPGLAPEIALAYLRGLSADLREAAVLGAAGELLAGPPALAAAGRELLAADPEAETVERREAHEILLAARSASHAVVGAYAPPVLLALALHDLRRVLAVLPS